MAASFKLQNSPYSIPISNNNNNKSAVETYASAATTPTNNNSNEPISIQNISNSKNGKALKNDSHILGPAKCQTTKLNGFYTNDNLNNSNTTTTTSMGGTNIINIINNHKSNTNAIMRPPPPSISNDTTDANSRLERNYSYIEAMKEDSFHPKNEAILNNSNIDEYKPKKIVELKSESFNMPSSKLNYHHQNASPKLNTALAHSSLPSSSPSSSSTASSSSSSTLSSSNLETSQNRPNNGNISKSKSQSSILNLFKSTFSPFTIRKWRSKSRDKLSSTQNSSQIADSPSTPSNDDRIRIKNLKSQSHNSTPVSNNNSLFQKNQQNSKSKSKSNKFTSNPKNDSLNLTDISVTMKPLPFSPNTQTNKTKEQTLPNPKQATYLKEVITSTHTTTRTETSSSSSTTNYDQIDYCSNYVLKSIRDKYNTNASASPLSTKSIETKIMNFTNTSLNSSKPNDTTVCNSSDKTILSNLSTSSNSLNSKNRSPQSERQLSYLKLACLVNGYDSFNNSKANEDTTDSKVIVNTNNSDSALNTPTTLISNLNIDIKINIEPKTENDANRDESKELVNNQNVNLQDLKDDDVAENANNEVIFKQETQVNNDSKLIENSSDINSKIEDANQIIVQDGHYYIKLLDENTKHIHHLCNQYQNFIEESNPERVTNDDALGQIQTTIGKAHLLINQKFKQFRGLCEKNIRDKSDSTELKEGEFVTLDEDLAGFWDMVCLQIDDIKNMFDLLKKLKENNWILEQPTVAKKVVKKPLNNSNTATKTKLNTSVTSSADTAKTNTSKARADAARQRLLEAKKNAALNKQKELAQNTNNNLVDDTVVEPTSNN